MSSRLCIERIPSLESLAAEAHPDDAAVAETFGSLHRRREFLAWRAAVRRIAGTNIKIGYDEYGAPQIVGSPIFISVSHSRDHVAVAISDRPCAVDIENPSRDFGKVLSRYLTAEELALSSHPDFHAAAWCAKETLYKYHRRGGLNLLSDIRITAIDFESGEIRGTIPEGEEIVMKISYHEGDIAVSIV